MVDLDTLEAAGLANARRRATVSGFPPTYSLQTAAEALGLRVDDVTHFWAMLGLTVASPDQLALSQADVDALATCAAMSEEWGEDGTSDSPRSSATR